MIRRLVITVLALVSLASAQDRLRSEWASTSTSGSIISAGADCSAQACVWLVAPANVSSVSIQLTGTFAATLQFEQSVDGVNWVAISATGGSSSTTTTGIYNFSMHGTQFVRVRCSAYTSGSVGVSATVVIGTGGATITDSAGVVSLFTGCSGTQSLGADGACHSGGTGTVTATAGALASTKVVTGAGTTDTKTVANAPTVDNSTGTMTMAAGARLLQSETITNSTVSTALHYLARTDNSPPVSGAGILNTYLAPMVRYDLLTQAGGVTGAQNGLLVYMPSIKGKNWATTTGSITSNGSPQSVPVTDSAAFQVGQNMTVDPSKGSSVTETVNITAIADGTHISGIFTHNHSSGARIAISGQGDKIGFGVAVSDQSANSSNISAENLNVICVSPLQLSCTGSEIDLTNSTGAAPGSYSGDTNPVQNGLSLVNAGANDTTAGLSVSTSNAATRFLDGINIEGSKNAGLVITTGPAVGPVTGVAIQGALSRGLIIGSNQAFIASAVHSVGAGLSDTTSGGLFSGTTPTVYCIQLQTAGTPDTFEWDTVGCTTFVGGTNVAITGAAQTLASGVTITFAATTGHTATDQWTVSALPNSATNPNYVVKDPTVGILLTSKGTSGNVNSNTLRFQGLNTGASETWDFYKTSGLNGAMRFDFGGAWSGAGLNSDGSWSTQTRFSVRDSSNAEIGSFITSGSTSILTAGVLQSNSASKATSGTVRFAKGDTIGFRNNANSANIVGLSLDTSDNVVINKTTLTPPTTAWTITPAADNQTTTIPTGTLVANSVTVNGHALSSNVTVTTTDLSLNNVTNDAQTKAAVVPNTAPTAGQFPVGNAGNTAYAPQSMTGDCSLTSAGAITCATKQANAIVNVTPVSTVASNTSVQNLMTVSIPAGALNTAGKTLHIYAPATYTTGAGTSNGIQTWLLRLCTVSGCGSGTVVNMVSIASATDVISTTNGRVEFECYLSTISTGASGTIEPHGHLGIVLATTATTPPTVYYDGNTAASSAIDLTAAQFVQVSVTMATNGSTTNSSIATERQLVAEVK